ncbi:MAG: DAK2 domain-containing protein [Oscillospiraceae bacterium]|jgi:DAK2 domain fusion protein YloV|nr:DAK2 domain-containing protein [Oscillospiraceae bacterium]
MISGRILRDAMVSAANNIYNLRDYVNSLNVFPVPDGDTGSNMSRTIGAAKMALEGLDDDVSVGEVIKLTASSLLRGARGNSGVILSLIFRGLCKILEEKREITRADFSKALKSASATAYGAVLKPTEGTILTVIRLVAEASDKFAEESGSFCEFWGKLCQKTEEVLKTTPSMLPVLAEAGVVDSGGQGLLIIFEGMKSVFDSGEIIPANELTQQPEVETVVKQEECSFFYCTELLVTKSDPDLSVDSLESFLGEIGDSVIVVDGGDVIKVHVHTNNPGLAIEKGLEYGMLSEVKVDNLLEEIAEKEKKNRAKNNEFEYKTVSGNTKFGFVAVVSGDGLCELFKNLGVDNVVSGGQTMNPSTGEILSAIEATPAKVVFVLPNNKNIIMTAEQTINLADRDVIVLPTRTIPQGVSAVLSFDASKDTKANQTAMLEAIEKVKTGLITNAVRNSKVGGKDIKAGDIIAIENGKIKFSEESCSKACLRLVKSLVKKQSSYVTLFYGADVSLEEANTLENQIRQKYDKLEVNMVNGGQPVYHFVVSVE